MPSLVVVLGAGASYDCASSSMQRNPDLQPPLVKDLFSPRASFAQILNSYPLAEMAAAEIRTTLEHEAVALEEYLRTRLRDSKDSYARRRYRQVPLYFQDLFYEISQPASRASGVRGYTRQADHYDVLLNLTLRLEQVVYVTLNYDTLLDQRLESYDPIESMDDYVAPDRNWSLLKLHGSINWMRETTEETTGYFTGPGSAVTTSQYLRAFDNSRDLDLGSEITLSHRDSDLEDSRVRELVRAPSGPTPESMLGVRHYRLLYPALSAPLGSADELSCPGSHTDFLTSALHGMGSVNLLVIGYSGYDQEVLRLLDDNASGIKSLLVANGPHEASDAAAARIMEHRSERYGEESVFAGGFGELISSGRLSKYVSTLT